MAIVIAAYNEETVLRAKLENTLDIDYPADKLDVVVVSDASTDGTDRIASEFAERGVRLYRMQERSGKTAAQNAGVELARGDYLVFSDANSMYAPDALKQLLAPFADPGVGCVCGELQYANPGEGGAGKGEGVYWRYEQFLKLRESMLSSALGGQRGDLRPTARLLRGAGQRHHQRLHHADPRLASGLPGGLCAAGSGHRSQPRHLRRRAPPPPPHRLAVPVRSLDPARGAQPGSPSPFRLSGGVAQAAALAGAGVSSGRTRPESTSVRGRWDLSRPAGPAGWFFTAWRCWEWRCRSGSGGPGCSTFPPISAPPTGVLCRDFCTS